MFVDLNIEMLSESFLLNLQTQQIQNMFELINFPVFVSLLSLSGGMETQRGMLVLKQTLSL